MAKPKGFKPDELDHIKRWMRDRSARGHPSEDESVLHAEAARLAGLAADYFKIDTSKGPDWLTELATDCLYLPEEPRVYGTLEWFGFSKEDMLDIAFWCERDDGFGASAVQVSQFIRAVIRGNLAELRTERKPPVFVKVKRASRL
jgi:hypothetical protein